MEGAGLHSSLSDKTVKDSCKYLTVSLGHTLKCHTDIQDYLRKRRPELEEAINEKDYDVILAVCHFNPQLSLSDRKESIATFLGNLPGSKPVALVVLHQTCYPENIVSDIIRDLPRRNMVKVVYLLQENEELQQSPHNETILNEVADWLISHVRKKKSRKTPPPIPPKTVKVFSHVIGNTLGSHKKFVGTLCSRRAGLQEVSTVEECEVILCFCPVVSRAGTDIEAALQKLNNIPVTKDVVLVVLHHTFNSEYTVPDSSRSVSRENTLTVDCLFYEDRGLLQCNRNEEAFRTVFKLIDTKIEEKKPEIINPDPCTAVKLFKQPLTKYLIIRPGRTLRCQESIMQSLQKRPELQKVSTAEECDVILAFCCIYPQGGSDIEETINLIDNLPDSKPVAFVVLHQPSYPEHIPDISGFFTREIMLEVDFLFQENEELLQCTKNESSLKKVEHWLISELKEKKPAIKNADPGKTEKFKQPLHKYLIIRHGKTLKCHESIMQSLQKQRPELQEVLIAEECDVILAFCHIIPQRGNDIEETMILLANLPDTKPVVLAVLHQPYHPEHITDISEAFTRENMVKVDFLFHENEELQQSMDNETSLRKIANLLIPEGLMSPDNTAVSKEISTPCLPQMNNKSVKVKVFSRAIGKTLGSHKQFVGALCSRRAGIQEVSTVEECDVILCFSPVVSRTGTDIEAALQKLNDIPVSKDVVLVVLHHTFNQECMVPDSSRAVSRKNTLTVDCLFHEDRGLLHCSQNEEAFRTLLKLMDTKGCCGSRANLETLDSRKSRASTKTSEESLTKTIRNKCAEASKGLGKMLGKLNEVTVSAPHFFSSLEAVKLPGLPQKKFIKVFSLVTGKTLGFDKDFVKTLCDRRAGLQKVFTVEECDVILCFCPVVSQAVVDIEASLQKLNNETQGFRPVVLVVLHHTFNAESIVPDSSKCVSRKNTLAVDCLFFEDRGILHCSKNEEAYHRVLSWIESQQSNKESSLAKHPEDDTQLKKFKNDSHMIVKRYNRYYLIPDE